ncbi:rRNA maturation RNase YbeY [Blattabacterium cuenoti]|uniref:rRNA maturation RNase YbeY n=1 Tax=Blattabacterium cuenoti TaxID=1653831 RepID=UPI00163B95D8|nr:rRNA maturation RNase YbeY [Blattabacterium cuenoti]
MINLFYEISNFSITNRSLFIQTIYLILRNEGKEVGNINYIFCNDHYLLNLNKKYLQKDYYTDVIAFAYSSTTHPSNKNRISGDVFISIDRVLENSQQWNQLFQVELKRVMIHAILHFLGYEDRINEKFMKKKEEFYLILFQF